MSRLRSVSHSTVIAYLALFIALGSSAFAATQLKKNSVGTKQIKNNAITAAKIKKGTITGSKINLSTLGTVPSATHATSADSATTVPPAEAIHIVGAPGQPAFEHGSSNLGEVEPGISFPPVSFYKDQFGVVHLEGVAKVPAGNGPIFTLPPGYRIASGTAMLWEPFEKEKVLILGSDFKGLGAGVVQGQASDVSLNGIAFRAQG